MHRGCCYLRQPLSLAYGSPAPRKGEPFGLSLYCTKRRPRKRGSCRRMPTEGEHLVPFCISKPFPFRHGFRRDTNAGWNMVVLLRCRLQYSLFRPILPSLHRPLGVLGSNPPQAGTAFGQRLNHKNERVHKKRSASTLLSLTLLCFLALHRAGCNALYYVPLAGEIEYDYGHNAQQYQRHCNA